MVNEPNLTPSQKQMYDFLALLDRSTKHFYFRTFDDKKGSDRQSLKGNLSGTIRDHEATLMRRNGQEAGVFVVVNEGGHTDKDITRVRAVFADTDGAPLKPIVDALAPHAVVCSSPGKYHVYWLVDDSFPVERFQPIQKCIAKKFGTDTSVTNLSRVMRMPGFVHNKYDPFEVRFYYLNFMLPRYSIEQIVEGLGLQAWERPGSAGRAAAIAELPQPRGAQYARLYSLSETERMLMRIDPWTSRGPWMDVIFALADEYGEAGRHLAVRWSRGDLWSGSNIHAPT